MTCSLGAVTATSLSSCGRKLTRRWETLTCPGVVVSWSSHPPVGEGQMVPLWEHVILHAFIPCTFSALWEGTLVQRAGW